MSSDNLMLSTACCCKEARTASNLEFTSDDCRQNTSRIYITKMRFITMSRRQQTERSLLRLWNLISVRHFSFEILVCTLKIHGALSVILRSLMAFDGMLILCPAHFRGPAS